MWPMQNPWLPPEKRPSVRSATQSPRPAPMMALVGVSISGRPGPPLGPSYRMMTTCPHSISLFSSPRIMASSLSYTLATPLKVSPSLPVILATPPPGQRLPYIIWRCPVALMGSLSGLMISWPSVSPGSPATFSACVLPVTVIWLPSNRPFSIMNLMMAGVPPTFCTSSMTNLPLGLRSARKGVSLLMRWKSSSSMRTLGSWQLRLMAMRCSTALVDPPVTITMRMAFSKAVLVMMSRGLRSNSSRFFITAPMLSHSAIFSAESAGLDEEKGRLIPRASIAVAMVFAVYMPPHAPCPGHECCVISRRSSSLILSYKNWP
mmetsp:Transcript_58075/g.131592  ORF Transcript_58075/g.131592 Transcript_58075/m.131592 type:complete len:319 (-) Transcript_58075:690-1646(-)